MSARCPKTDESGSNPGRRPISSEPRHTTNGRNAPPPAEVILHTFTRQHKAGANMQNRLPAWRWMNLPVRNFEFLVFTPKRFHVLLNSLFKVLFNFPSRYLFAIGLVAIFSLRWSIPPTWGCTLKQPDSKERSSRCLQPSHGPSTLYGQWPRSSSDLDLPRDLVITDSPTHNISRRPMTAGFCAGLFPFRSPLLRES